MGMHDKPFLTEKPRTHHAPLCFGGHISGNYNCR
jgi:hypothetical protein